MNEIVFSVPGRNVTEAHLDIHQPSDAMFPDVFVGKLAPDVRESLAQGKPVKGILLGVQNEQNVELQLTENTVNDLRSQLMKIAEDAFMLIWEGNKIPRGAEVNGHRIGWTQNGQVLSDTGEMIGVYDRLMEYGGESKKEQQMIVFVTVPPKV